MLLKICLARKDNQPTCLHDFDINGWCSVFYELLSLHKAYMKPTWSLHEAYMKPTLFLYVFNVYKGGKRLLRPWQQTLSLILAEKFSREFYGFLTRQHSIARYLAENSLENFVTSLNTNHYNLYEKYLFARQGVAFCIFAMKVAPHISHFRLIWNFRAGIFSSF